MASVAGILISISLFNIGCEQPGSNSQIRYEWKTVMEGDWGSHLYDVHFISEKRGWAVGNAVDLTPGADFGEGAESLIIHTNDGGQTWHRQHSGVFNNPLRNVYFRSASEGWSIGEGGVLIRTTDSVDKHGSTLKPARKIICMTFLSVMEQVGLSATGAQC